MNTTLWQNNYKEVCTYLTERNCSVNDVPDDAIFSNGKHMKRWLYEMNKALEGKSRYHLSDKQIELLNAIGINGLLSATDKDWLLRFEELRRFYSEHHHFKIPADYLCSDGTKLRGWIRLQRYRYRDGKLQQKYIDEFRKHDLMEALETPLDTAMRHIEEYHKEHGDIDFETSYVCPDGYPLGTWLRTFRDKVNNQKNKKPFPQAVIERLNELGIIWNKTDYIWEQNFLQCKAYLDQHEGYSIPENMLTEYGTSLKSWILRNLLQYNRGSLSAEKMEQLASIHINEIEFFETDEKSFAAEASALQGGTDADKPPEYDSSFGSKFDWNWMQNFESCRRFLEHYAG